VNCRKCGGEMELDAENQRMICHCLRDMVLINSLLEDTPVMTEREKQYYRAAVSAALYQGGFV